MLKKFPKLPNQRTWLQDAKYTRVQMRHYGILCIKKYLAEKEKKNGEQNVEKKTIDA